ncbi:hypothetical protein [Streptosporangium sp. NPDC051022]|uniref:hypothetical protein n=1 Tax=Streptosporangium sp. NPDC051022 TaxID=3155752 RepID=UPI00343582E1
MMRGRARRELELVAALEVEQERLEAAKQAAAEDPTPENIAAKRAEMASMAETRTWLRAAARLRAAAQEVVEYANATDPKDAAKFQAAQVDLERIPRLFGPLLAAMEELAGASSAAAGGETPPGSVSVTPRTVRGRARYGKDGV